MGKPRAVTDDPLPMLPPLPDWVRAGQGEGVAEAAFHAGAALAHLHGIAGMGTVPLPLWRERLALRAAVGCVALAGRREEASALRDAVHLARAGDDPGPAGAVLRQWLRAVGRPVSAAHLARVVEGMDEARVTLCLAAQGETPVDRAAAVIEAVLADAPRAETAALILADAVLSRGIGQAHLLPLLGVGMAARDVRLRGGALRLACHRAVRVAAGQAVPLAGELARGAARLRAVAPVLRAKAAGRAVELFLTRDALAPVALEFMSDRAARRLCERLVDLGALRELTGRESFRLYGV